MKRNVIVERDHREGCRQPLFVLFGSDFVKRNRKMNAVEYRDSIGRKGKKRTTTRWLRGVCNDTACPATCLVREAWFEEMVAEEVSKPGAGT